MPQFLTTRYNGTVALTMAVFWLFLYVFVNLTSILYLGALAINGLLGGEYLHVVMIALALFAVIITLGGMKVIGYTDVIQVAVLIIGGLATTYMALTLVSEKFGLGRDAGEIVVGYEERTICESSNGPCSHEQYPVFWTGDLSKAPAAVRLDGARGVALGINPAGSIAVGSGGGQVGSYWRRDGNNWIRGNIPFGALVCQGCEYESGSAWDVNDAGIIVGVVTRRNDYQNFAYVYNTQTATGAVLPLPPGFVQSSAYAVGNVAGGIVHVAGVVNVH